MLIFLSSKHLNFIEVKVWKCKIISLHTKTKKNKQKKIIIFFLLSVLEFRKTFFSNTITTLFILALFLLVYIQIKLTYMYEK